jgi:hypothetical protein
LLITAQLRVIVFFCLIKWPLVDVKLVERVILNDEPLLSRLQSDILTIIETTSACWLLIITSSSWIFGELSVSTFSMIFYITGT